MTKIKTDEDIIVKNGEKLIKDIVGEAPTVQQKFEESSLMTESKCRWFGSGFIGKTFEIWLNCLEILWKECQDTLHY